MVSDGQPTKERVIQVTTALLSEGDELLVRPLAIEDGACVLLCEGGTVLELFGGDDKPRDENEVLLWPEGDIL